MIIKETSFFTKQVDKLLDEGSYRLLQLHLLVNPAAGDLIRGTGGLRKIRWQGSGRGKRGGIRAVYYWARVDGVILFLLAYAKKDKDDLTPDQKKILRHLVEEEFKS